MFNRNTTCQKTVFVIVTAASTALMTYFSHIHY